MDRVRLDELLNRHVDGSLTEPLRRELEQILLDSPDARAAFWRFTRLHSLIREDFQSRAGRRVAVDDVPQIILTEDVNQPSGFWPKTIGWLSQTGPFSYMVATVFMCLLLLGFWAYKLPSDRGSSTATNENSRGLTDPEKSSPDRPAPVFVGRVTGIAGAKWSDEPNYIAPLGIRVALGRTYKLKTGLMEITYDSGAKVILEGPCSYEVDSTAGGYLALGKLVARVGAGGEGRGAGEVASGQWPVASVKKEGVGRKEEGDRPNAASLATSHSPLATNPSPLLTVRTPTAIVSDLGTEFGVEVAINGDTTSHVFQGMVVIQAGILGVGDAGMRDSDKRPATAVAGGESDQTVTLVAGQTVHVGRVRATHQEPVAACGAFHALYQTPPQFARRIVEPPKFIDLLDIVAGGDGRGNRRERGIDPVRGFRHQAFTPGVRSSDEQYAPVHWHRFIDGLFVPDGAVGPMQLDSAGHVFDGFPVTSGTTFGSIWGAADPKPWDPADDPMHGLWVYAMGRGEDFMPDGRGLLALCSNAGITFDLDAIRRVHRQVMPDRFRATAGMGDSSRFNPKNEGLADLWVFIDGRLAWKRMQLRSQDGPIAIDIGLGPDDRFLTLAVTDGGNGIGCDWVVFGDPILKMVVATETHIQQEDQPMEK